MSDKVRVLVADDEAHIRSLLKGVLTAMKTEVVAEARNGVEALEKFRAHKPHITLLDINMPLMDGLKTLQAIQAESPGALVVMLSSLSTLGIVQDCLEAGAYDFIRKDTPITEIKAIIKKTWEYYMQESRAAGGKP
ncbi:MAG: response regulator [Magnetococcales bacterium]|nr:response regulator [Magnetococcales bacterium]NGZ27597.1 response regulator [Magnetococcales bacterium]